MGYQRVLPRDLFNEAKLLKCLGRVVLNIHDCNNLNLQFIHENEDEGFKIEQDPNSGELYCSNLKFYCGNGGIFFSINYNSKKNYPLLFTDEDGNVESVLTDDGEFTTPFINYCNS